MKNSRSSLWVYLGLITLIYACNDPEVIHDLSNKSFPMVNQDSISVNFPQDFKGKLTVVSFIYTHCPDVCPVITANMNNIYHNLADTSDIRFAEITFDPKRDKPSVLKDYMNSYKLDEQKFTMLTADSTTTDSVMKKMGIQTGISYRDTTDAGKALYFMKHTNRISIMDEEGRIRFEYPGSVVPPKNVLEDIQKIR